MVDGAGQCGDKEVDGAGQCGDKEVDGAGRWWTEQDAGRKVVGGGRNQDGGRN